MSKTLVLSSISATICTLITVIGLHISSAQVMQSENYHIQSDSLNVGGADASSLNYFLRSTIGEVATGISDSDSYRLGAGFQHMQEIYLALSGVTDVVMSDSIPGVTGGESTGSTTVTVITDSPSGYVLTIASVNDPAMQKGADSIADYNPGENPEFNFTTDIGEAHFGFSPEGEDIVSRFKDNGGSCNVGGTLDTHLSCWDGLSTTGQTIASDTNPNHPNGATTTVYFKVGIGAQTNTPPGEYVATTTVTALPL